MCLKQLANNKVRINVPNSLAEKLQRGGGGRDCVQMLLESLTGVLEPYFCGLYADMLSA